MTDSDTTKNIITQALLKELVTYNPETGIFTRNSSNRRKSIGETLGGTPRKDKYMAMRVGKHTYLLHRLAFLYMMGNLPVNLVDHINGNKSDNRWCNLREATAFENHRNSKLSRNSSTGVKGLCYIEGIQPKYHASVRVSGKRLTKTLHLKGRVESEVVAQLTAWLEETRDIEHKEFARHG